MGHSRSKKNKCPATKKVSGRIFQLCNDGPKVYFRTVAPLKPAALVQIENTSTCIMEAIIELNNERQITQSIEQGQQVTIDVFSIRRLLIKCSGKEEEVCRGYYSLCLRHRTH